MNNSNFFVLYKPCRSCKKKSHKIPAVLFAQKNLVNFLWAKNAKIAQKPLFFIQNRTYLHNRYRYFGQFFFNF